MAIDSAEKRKSVSGIPFVPLIPGVTPNASKDQEWRQESLWSYPGIAAAAITAIHTWTLKARDIAWTLASRTTNWTLKTRDTDWTLKDRS